MGGSKKGGQTPVPNYQGAATATSLSSRPNWSSAFGGQSWQIDPNTGQATMSVSTPQALQGTIGNLQGNMNAASRLDPTQARNQAIQSNYNQAASRLDPQWGQAQQQFQSQMANMGGSDNPMAGAQAGANFNRAQNDAYQGAMNNAIQLGNQTQQTQMAQSELPFQQYGQLQNSVYANPYMGQPANYLGAAQNTFMANQANNNASTSKKNSGLGGMGNIAGSMMGGKGGGAAGGAAGGASSALASGAGDLSDVFGMI